MKPQLLCRAPPAVVRVPPDRWDLGIAAEVMDVFQLAFRRLNRFTQQGKRFDGIVEALPALLQSVSASALLVRRLPHYDQARMCTPPRRSRLWETGSYSHNIAEVFIFAIQPVDPADGLEETMILHGFVDIEISAGRCIKASQQFIHHHQ